MVERQPKRKLELEDKGNMKMTNFLSSDTHPRRLLKPTTSYKRIRWEGISYDPLERITPTKEEEFRRILQSRQSELATGEICINFRILTNARNFPLPI
jgi:hypothetical protein